MKTVTRFAPSPTGYIHIGNLRSAIYPYLVAKQDEGTFILRIEDTDRARYVEGATDLIKDTLKWIGLDWDEGPDKGGENGPYFQTQRQEIYVEWARSSSLLAVLTPTQPQVIKSQNTVTKPPKTSRHFCTATTAQTIRRNGSRAYRFVLKPIQKLALTMTKFSAT